MAELYTILLEEDVPVDPRKYGDIVAPVLGLTRPEARMAVRKGRGLFLENLAEAAARRIADELEQDGIRARLVPGEQIPSLPPPRKITQLEHGDELLTYLSGTEREGLPWDALLVASCGVVARPEYRNLFDHVRFEMIPPLHKLDGDERDLVRENLILKLSASPSGEDGRKKKKDPGSIFEEIEKKYGNKVKVYADLIPGDLGIWLRVPLDETAYVMVPGGVKMGGAWGFQPLVRDLQDRCAGAFTEMTLKLLAATDIKELVFPQIEEFTRYTKWIAIKRFLWPNAASSSPSPAAPESPTDGGSSNASPGPGPSSTSS